jgi:DNA-directed RNA polymerase subunit RPC12/RpoP
MICPYCRGPISRVRGLGQTQPEPNNATLYRCLTCGADFTTASQETAARELRQTDRRRVTLQPVWPRLST